MDLTQSLFQWLKTFDLSSNCGSVEDLCDGVAISHVLNQICPEYFKSDWLKKIETDCGTNWRLRVSNLRKVYEAVVDYYTEELDKQIDDKLLPDVTLIGRDRNTKQLALLLQLILGCAINCHRKEDFIAIMTNLDLEVQHGIKTAIQQMETFDDINSLGGVEPTLATNQVVIETNESSVQRCAELEAIVTKLNDEKLMLQLENERLAEKMKILRNYESNSNQKDSIDNEAVFQRLNNQIIGLQNDLLRTEEIKEDFRLNSELNEKEANKLRQQLDQTMSKLNDLKQDRDELDRLQYLNEELERYKNKEVVFQRRNDELKEAKRQLQTLDDRNVSLTKKICELEDEVKGLLLFKGQIDVFKRQKEDLRLKVGEEGFRADRAEEETKRMTKKYEELQHEKDKHINELNDLKAMLSQQKNAMSLEAEYAPVMHSTQHSVELMQKSDSKSTEIREKLTRLEFENSKLKESRQKSDDERVRLLESQLEEERKRVMALEKDQRLSNQKVIKLEAELRDSVRLTSDDEQMQTFQDIIKQKELSLEATKHELLNAQQEIDSLKAVVIKKDEDLNDREDQYKKYVNKAKAVSTALDQLSQQSISSISSTSSDANNDINYWKQLVQQKDLELSKFKQDFDETNSLREMEAKLLTISFHNLSSHLQRKSAEDRIRNGSLNSGQNSVSFLARQRQATTRKYNMPTVSQSEFFD